MRDKIKDLVQEELDRANEKFPQFHSAHEGFAVLLEEYDELNDEIQEIKFDMQALWNTVKCNENSKKYIDAIYVAAINAAMEAIQVAAMARKFQQMQKGEWVK